MSGKVCCAPSRGADAPSPAGAPAGGACALAFETVEIPGGQAFVGTDQPVFPIDSEGPLKRRRVRPFRMQTTAVTNAMFAAFVEATGHVTEAERFGWSFVFHTDVPISVGPTEGVVEAPWWRRVDGATWRQINGPGTGPVWKPDHPAVHVSWNDAAAFAAWAGGRLPTEAEWEHAARGGLGPVKFPWGDREPDDDAYQPCNIWQGRFPEVNTAKDGYLRTAPAKSFEPNGYGLYNMCGNAWEWTAEPFKLRSLSRAGRARAAQSKGMRLLKGGSFLCHKSYCYRYRIAARTGSTPDSTTPHQSFRLVFDA